MPRAIWKGAISFGMVTIPVKLFTATDSKDISFRQLHGEDHAPVKYQRVCSADGDVLDPGDIVKGYEYSKDRYVVVDDEDFDKLPLPSKHTVELTAFVKSEEIDPIYYEKSYYLEPEEIAGKPYTLLTRALAERELVAIGKVALRNKERLCALRVSDGSLVMETLHYPDEIRGHEWEAPDVEVSEAEMKAAFALIDLLEEEFHPENYRDEYRDALLAIITAKLEGEEVVIPEQPEAKPAVDLMAALKASVEAAKSRKDEAGSSSSNGSSGTRKSSSRSKKKSGAAAE